MKIRDLFDRCAAEYDQNRRKLVPYFAEFYGMAMRSIPFAADSNIDVLDLGAGTGLLSAMITEAFPNAKIHLADISKEMLAQAKSRFSNNPRITYLVQEHLQLRASSEFDLIISALSIHHLRDEDKIKLFKKIYYALRPGGIFINADQALAPTEQEEIQYETQ